ncbi:MAG: hypothetical protein PVJ38_01485 [Candidatus Bathyarchaeota archaeon]|jgi:hypothetical protein
MPAEVILVLALYGIAVTGTSLWLHQRGSDLDKKINELKKKR